MRLYHGGLEVVEHPRILPSEHIGDSGSGFYTTSDISQARRFVVTKCNRENRLKGIVLIYEAPDDLISNGYGLRIRAFRQADALWAQFVLANRKRRNFEHDYDVVAGQSPTIRSMPFSLFMKTNSSTSTSSLSVLGFAS